ncbi:DUF4396 domain-containing protein [Kushneria indalinina]|uniref:Uncharacterized protein DUF4396 n=1 Tax=Kushneria indalinina DSM 14324 TaxID=1122140 RepID=A0A3D9DVL5_9GAMM|nr:DUF4396 domain-containing protein [Kushneria indalinina]REC94820.1 uncharacterized protein DUF4396 [Kushneria indalinina DSM 14324]
MLIFWSWVFLLLGVVTCALIAADVRRRPQHMAIMNVTWPITGLYMPVLGWWVYQKMGRTARADQGHDASEHHQHGGHEHHGDKPQWQGVFVSATHCGGGCTLGDITAAPLATALGFTLFGSHMAGHFLLAFVAAYAFGILFQYLPIREMGERSPKAGLLDAIKADTLSLIAFQIGMYLWMLIATPLLLDGQMDAATPEFWFMMQIAMLVGFLSSYPANWLLVNKGIKHAM